MTNSRNRRALKVGSGLAALAGLALIVVLIAYQGVAELGRVMFGAAVCLFGMSAKGQKQTSGAAANYVCFRG
jgi:Zn-dependent protease